jgi:hypothetical protein
MSNTFEKQLSTTNIQSKAKKEEVDYLTEDPILEGQKFVCVSFLKPSSIIEEKRPKDLSVCGFKVRGVYSDYDEAKKRADFLNKCDPFHNIYIGEIGKWCPFEDDTEKAKDSEYMNNDLNKLMKSYWNQQSDAKQFHELRKQEMIQKALQEVKQKKEDQNVEDQNVEDQNVEDQNVEDQSVETKDNQTVKIKKSKSKSKITKINEMKSSLENNKADLDKEKNEIDNNINTLRRLEDELTEKIKEMELEKNK